MLGRTSRSFFYGHQSVVGIDIGNRYIKMVEARPGKIPHIATLNCIPTPEGALDNGIIVRCDAVADAIRTMYQQAGCKTRQAVTMVSGINIITRYIKLPKMTPKEITSTLKWEAKKHIPLSEEEDLIIEHLILDDAREAQTSQVNVLLVAAPRRMVYLISEAFNLAGLILKAVEIEPLALWRSVGDVTRPGIQQLVKTDEAFIVLDLGAKWSNFAVFRGGVLCFSRYIPVGGDMITEFLVNVAGKDFDTAQRLKEKEGELLTEENLENVSPEKRQLDQWLREGFAPLISEVKRSIDFYLTQFKNNSLSGLVLSGGTAKLRGVGQFLQEELDLPAVLGLQGFSLPPTQSQFRYGDPLGLDPAFAVSLGLALRGVAE